MQRVNAAGLAVAQPSSLIARQEISNDAKVLPQCAIYFSMHKSVCRAVRLGFDARRNIFRLFAFDCAKLSACSVP
jgi:hypothetical protein